MYTGAGIFAWTVATTGPKGGTLDTESGVLVREHDRQLEHDLSGLRSFRSLRLGPYVVCWLCYTKGNALDAPYGLVVAVAAALEATTQTGGIGWVLAAWGVLFVLLAWVA